MLLEFFTDPILRAPTIGSMLMCLSSALIGCLVFLQRRSLVGEALSHAAYPGIVASVVLAALLFPMWEGGFAVTLLVGAACTSLLGLFVISWMEKKLKIYPDSALCFVLSLFFGVGVLLASRLQFTHTLWFRKVQIYLFGQAATMVDAHIFLYGILSLVVLVSLLLLYHFLKTLYFDPTFATCSGMPIKRIEGCVTLLLVLAIIVGMRSVGVVLMSAMLIAPAAAARQWTKSLATFLLLAALLGMTAAFFGTALSLWIPGWTHAPSLALPTGPMIVLTAAAISFLSLLFAPKQGMVTRLIRLGRFRLRRRQENILKSLYKGKCEPLSATETWMLERKGWMAKGSLTREGRREAEKLIRLHRLWEVYLVHMGQAKERVHHSAEEMEHLLTSDMEKELQKLLDHPRVDPHSQPIPKGEGP
jgi:manganese/zinc/iron transport system permease protein